MHETGHSKLVLWDNPEGWVIKGKTAVLTMEFREGMVNSQVKEQISDLSKQDISFFLLIYEES